MKLGGKVVVAGLIAAGVSLVISLVTQLVVLRKQGIDMMHDSMRGIIVAGENVRQLVSQMNKDHAFRSQELLEELKQSKGELQQSKIYATIPVVSAWKSIGAAAKSEEYEFRVPKFQARNPVNTPTPDEEIILKELEKGDKDELRIVDSEHKLVIYARPIRLTADCLACHGDPKNSPTGDGKDFLGFKMENWKEGEVHGAFVLKATFEHLNEHVEEGFAKAAYIVVPTMVGFAVVLVGFLYWIVNYVILKPVHASIEVIKTGCEKEVVVSSQIAGASTTLAEASTEQAASLEETSAALEEISSMTKRNAEHADAAAQLAGNTRQSADAGAADMKDMVVAMNAIKASSDNIAVIIKTIDEIAFQTNILALNAAVEAARAGEAGAGFAVVADEVRALAQRSANAAKETAEKIEDSIRKSEHGVAVSSKVSGRLDEIHELARKMDALVREIASGSKEQSQGIGQVNEAISQLDKVTQQNAATAEEAAGASTELTSSSEDLEKAVQQLILVVGEARQKQHKAG